MQRSTDRIHSTHVGSLARPVPLLDLMRAAAEGEPAGQELRDAQRRAVLDVVARQRQAGIDVINDGEQGKTGFFAYIGQRLSGYSPGGGRTTLEKFRPEIEEFPEYYEGYFKRAMTGGMAVPAKPLICTGPVSYIGRQAIAEDLAALRSAVGDAGPDEVFVCAVAPSGVGGNEYYRSEDDYLDAIADALHVEYQAIIDAGFTLQIDDPFLTEEFSYGDRLGRGEAGHRPAVRGRDQPQPRGHSEGPGAAAHLLRHQRGPAGARRAARRPDRDPADDRGGRLLLRGRQPAA